MENIGPIDDSMQWLWQELVSARDYGQKLWIKTLSCESMYAEEALKDRFVNDCEESFAIFSEY